MLTEIVLPRLVADKQQPIGQHANPRAIGPESAIDVVVHVEGHHTPCSTTNYHAARYLRVAAQTLRILLSENVSQEFHEWRTSRHEKPSDGGLGVDR